MDNRDRHLTNRRNFLKLLGGGVVVLPLATLTACGNGASDATPASAPPQPAPKPTAAPPAQTQPAPSAPAQEAATELQRLSEDDAPAKALAYVHDASTITNQPRYEAGQRCSNCVLYQGKPGEEWGGCSIFPGKAVNANGWCNAYAPKPAAG